eukprot:SAG31_NODE_19173_length_610_cov_0.902153_2_plen_113_part_01
MVQTVAYSHKMTEIGGPDENLAAFRSLDGKSFMFQQVIASRNRTKSACSTPHQCQHWEGPGENDLVALPKDGPESLLTVFRVDSCHPYWSSKSRDGGKHWSPGKPLAPSVIGS